MDKLKNQQRTRKRITSTSPTTIQEGIRDILLGYHGSILLSLKLLDCHKNQEVINAKQYIQDAIYDMLKDAVDSMKEGDIESAFVHMDNAKKTLSHWVTCNYVVNKE